MLTVTVPFFPTSCIDSYTSPPSTRYNVLDRKFAPDLPLYGRHTPVIFIYYRRTHQYDFCHAFFCIPIDNQTLDKYPLHPPAGISFLRSGPPTNASIFASSTYI